MPWKKNFDVEEAVESAMQVFWAKGYEATSITDLIEATGVQRQSLYNAIGDKRKFFIRALLKYDTERRQSMLATLESRGTPLESIKTLFSHIVEQCSQDEGKRGCFLVNTALNLHNHDEEVRMLVGAAIENFRCFFERLIDHGKVRQEIPAEIDARSAASGLLAMIIGMRVLARGAGKTADLHEMAKQALRLVA